MTRSSGVTVIMVMPDTLPLAETKAHLSEIVDRVENEHDRVVLTRNGRAAAVIMSPEDLEAPEDTVELLSDPKAQGDRPGPTRGRTGKGRHRRRATRQLPAAVSEPPYRLVMASSAERALARLPEVAAAAVVEFATGALVEAPRVAGHPLRQELMGRWAARRGPYWAAYGIDDDARAVSVLRVDHRADVYRSR